MEEPLLAGAVKVPRAERRRRVHEALEAAGLRPASDFAARYPHELSGGQRQRVVIAGALVMDPELVVADEPVSMLDVSIRTELLRLMLDLRRDRGLTYLFITHDLAIAWVLADRIAVMYLGKIMEIGPAEESSGRRATRTRQALVSVSPSPDPPEPGGPPRTILSGETPDAAHVPPGCRFHPRCPLAFDRCRVEEPPLIEVARGHQAACWLATAGPRDLPGHRRGATAAASRAARRIARRARRRPRRRAPPPARSPRRRRSSFQATQPRTAADDRRDDVDPELGDVAADHRGPDRAGRVDRRAAERGAGEVDRDERQRDREGGERRRRASSTARITAMNPAVMTVSMIRAPVSLMPVPGAVMPAFTAAWLTANITSAPAASAPMTWAAM